MKFKLIFLGFIAVLSNAQAPTNAPQFTETAYEDANYIRIRRKQVNVTFIPEGASDQTWVGHWMNGSYSTLVRSDKEIYWELSMTLNVPFFVPNAFYMVWHQFYSESLTERKDDEQTYWESYACTVQHSQIALESSKLGKIDPTTVWGYGYRGASDFAGAKGLYQDLFPQESTNNMPWY